MEVYDHSLFLALFIAESFSNEHFTVTARRFSGFTYAGNFVSARARVTKELNWKIVLSIPFLRIS